MAMHIRNVKCTDCQGGVNVIPQVTGADIDSAVRLVVHDRVESGHHDSDTSRRGEQRATSVSTTLDLTVT